MENERLKVLEILEKGAITAQEAARLLDCLEEGSDTPSKNEDIRELGAAQGKKLRVLVNGTTKAEGRINVNVGVPMVLARLADDIMANCIPTAVHSELKNNGIDLSKINIGVILDTIETLDEDIVNVDLDQEEAKLKVRVYVE